MNAKIVKISFVITMLIIALAVLCGSSVAYAETVMIGGKPVGITIGAKGLVVIETTKVITDDGAKNPTEGKLLKGDILKTVNGKEVFTVSDLRKSVTEKKCTVNIERKGETFFDGCPVFSETESADAARLFISAAFLDISGNIRKLVSKIHRKPFLK